MIFNKNSLLANNGDPDQTLQNAASDLGLPCFPTRPPKKDTMLICADCVQYGYNTPHRIVKNCHLIIYCSCN